MAAPRQVLLERQDYGPDGTFGVVQTGTYECYSLERPTDGDHPCIPEGIYKVVWKAKADHPIHGPCYEVTGVPGRTAILIHPANWADQLRGCIALGRAIMDITRPDGKKTSKAVSSSLDAVAGFEADLEEANFILTVRRRED